MQHQDGMPMLHVSIKQNIPTDVRNDYGMQKNTTRDQPLTFACCHNTDLKVNFPPHLDEKRLKPRGTHNANTPKLLVWTST